MFVSQQQQQQKYKGDENEEVIDTRPKLICENQ